MKLFPPPSTRAETARLRDTCTTRADCARLALSADVSAARRDLAYAERRASRQTPLPDARQRSERCGDERLHCRVASARPPPRRKSRAGLAP
ncbi:Hypothetical protein A7982_01168 [Minicystis rosea]|nr:Hypothetical protein A7982_01168 [Minicystis rosea]